jgi:hypothetical protein
VNTLFLEKNETETTRIGIARLENVFNPETEFGAIRDDAFIGDESVARRRGGV